MERSSSSLSYEGSISDAITAAQTQKKLFVVYISGDDDVSTNLEQLTWMNQRVAESISKYCIFLHLVEGTVDALQFSAIYPQKSVPSISAVGYNGLLIWEHGGFISAENLVESVEKASASLQLQETAAAILTAALASKKSEPSSSSTAASSVKGSTSSSNGASTSTNNSNKSEAVPLTYPGGTENGINERISEKGDEVDENNFARSIHVGTEESVQSGLTGKAPDGLEFLAAKNTDVSGVVSTTCEVANNLFDCSHATAAPISAEIDSTSCDPRCMYENSGFAGDEEENAESVSVEKMTNCSVALESTAKSDVNDPAHQCAFDSQGNSKMFANEMERSQREKAEVSARSSSATKLTDVYLNIRLPNGTRLQMRFSVTDNLQSVKNYIDESTVSNLGAYDLAIPYPRKVFLEQDITKTLSELGFASREALIVVPHQRVTVAQGGQSSSYGTNFANELDPRDRDNGYFVFVKRMLSYMNPFSYLGGTSHSSSPEPDPSGLRQQGPTSQNYPSAAGGSYQTYASGERPRQPGNNATSSRFGSNIHTLRDVEGEDPPSDRNFFWNGNSTQFGGDDKN
uniref:UBX domain-containing protein 4 n=1 Tax=Anthurium amnicola TaxID=1678845 RepID=A0A1D1YEX6_9ARAE